MLTTVLRGWADRVKSNLRTDPVNLPGMHGSAGCPPQPTITLVAHAGLKADSGRGPPWLPLRRLLPQLALVVPRPWKT